MPQNRIIFFNDIHQSTYEKRKIKGKKLTFEFFKSKKYSNYIKEIGQNKNILYYFKKFNNLIFNDYFDKCDPTKISKSLRIKKFISKKINTIFFHILKKKNFDFFKNKNYVIFFFKKNLNKVWMLKECIIMITIKI